MAKTITFTDLRDNCAEVIDALESGQEFVITRDGRPVGELHVVSQRRETTTAELQARLAQYPWNETGKDMIADIDAVFPF